MEHCLALVVLLMSAARPVHLFSSGAPQAACTTLSPDATQHGALPQATDIPYVLNLSALYDPVIDQLVYTPNTIYEIVLEATAAAPTFRGLLIQSRLVADNSSDSAVVGRFLEPPVRANYQYSLCSYPEGSVTHDSSSEKSSIRIPWMAPSNGTESIYFGYAVVQTRQVYWANQRSAEINGRLCNLSFYFSRQTDSCVQQCPIFTFGNHTKAQCEPFSAVLDQGLQADATAYFGRIQTDTPLGTVVFSFRIIIDRTQFTNNDLSAIIVSLVRNNLVQNIFRFSDGTTDRQFLIGLAGGIDAANSSRVFPEIRLHDSRYIVYEDSVIYQQAPPSSLELPTTLDFDLNILVVGVVTTDVSSLTPFAVGTVDIAVDPCQGNPCPNRTVCTATGDETFICSCHPAYSGDDCEVLTNPCAFDLCQNGASCTNINNSTEHMCDCGNEFTGRDCETTIDHCALLSPNCNNGSCVDSVGTFTCQCDPGFTGEFCDVEIDECETAGCQNGPCEDLVNGFQCLCYPGWTGELCDTDIDYCALDTSDFGPCDDTGANGCIDGNSTYSCVCGSGYSGYNCTVDIDFCDPTPCLNGGTCTNFAPDRFECTCPSGYSGTTCGVDLTPCDPNPCIVGSNCTDLGQGAYSCDNECSPFYLDGATRTCVHQCPIFFFGNHTLARCQPFPADLDQGLQADATAYFGSIQTATPLGAVVFSFRIVIDRNRFTNTDLSAIIVTLTRNNLVQSIFKFSDGSTDRQFLINLAGGIDAVNASRVFPEIRLYDSRYIVYEDSVIYNQGPPSTLELPTTLDFDLNIIVVGVVTTDVASLTPFAVGTVDLDRPPDPCSNDPCQNGGVCIASNDQFTCDCVTGYTGDVCDILDNPCILEPCQNGGTCSRTASSEYTCDCGDEFTGQDCEVTIDHCALLSPNCNNGSCVDGVGTFACQCDPGFTADFCDVEINECLTAGCQNGTCEDLVNGFRCSCYPGWTGELCDTDIDYCALDTSDFGPCDDTGATGCNDQNSTYTCTCVLGFTGYNCSMDVDDCDPNPCQNGGNCTNFLSNDFECSCPNGFGGDTCEIVTNPCDQQPCVNGGTCSDLGSGLYSCSCAQEFTGQNCETDLPECTPVNPCQNGGTCAEQDGPGFTCMCPPGFTDQTCGTVLVTCQSVSCFNGGTCIEQPAGNVICNCTEGFDGERCQNDLPFCLSATCLNGGTCVEGLGTATSCNCTHGFSGDRCEIDDTFCRSDSCLNGGTCVEGLGTATSCNCTSEFAGDRCEVALMFCMPHTCQNGGTCDDSGGFMINCSCADGYTGMICDQDDPNYIVCTSDLCLNGGTCFEEFGPNTRCECSVGFTGDRCETDLPSCRPDSCLNNGTCFESTGDQVICQCLMGFDGDRCEIDLDFCREDSCLNEGECIEGFGTDTRCECPEGFGGDRCDTDLCTPDSCLNDGFCIGTATSCDCVAGFDGDRCEIDLDFCRSDSCLNDGTCVEGYGILTSCNCTEGFDGDRCESNLPSCQTDSCLNGGTCIEGVGTNTYCRCAPGFTGEDCTAKLELCVDGEFTFDRRCDKQCPDGFYGDGITKDCKEIAEGYKLQLNATIYYASISFDAQIGSSVLDFTLYLNNSYYQTPSSVILQLEAGNQFTSYFSFRSGQSIDELPFSTSNPAHTVDPLKVLSTIVYTSQAPPGRYQSTLTVTVRAREELGLSQLEDVQTSALLFTVTEDSSRPTDRLRLIYWVVAGVGTVVVVSVILCFVVSCWYCFMRKTKRKRYYFETAGAAMMIENPNTGGLSPRSGTWTGSVKTKLQSRDSAPEMDAVETATTTFTNQLES